MEFHDWSRHTQQWLAPVARGDVGGLELDRSWAGSRWVVMGTGVGVMTGAGVMTGVEATTGAGVRGNDWEIAGSWIGYRFNSVDMTPTGNVKVFTICPVEFTSTSTAPVWNEVPRCVLR